MSAKTFEISAPKAKVAADVASPSVPSNHGKSAFNNLKLQQYEWLAAHPKAIVFLVLGIHDHCGRYSEMALQLAAAGFSVYSFDMMGHGRSEGTRGSLPNMDNVVFDLHAFVCDTLTKVSPEIKYFIVSKAVGAVFVNHLHARIMADNFARKPAGFVCISPAGRIEKTYSSAHKALAKAISKVAPNVGVAKVKAELMNRDPAEQQKYVNDELVYHGAIRADTASTVLKAMRTSDFTLMRAPVLVLSAALEKVVDADAAPYLYQCLPSTDKLIKVYDHCYHDLVHEPEKLTVINEMVEWMNAVLSVDASNNILLQFDKQRVANGLVSGCVSSALFGALGLARALPSPLVCEWRCVFPDCTKTYKFDSDYLNHVRLRHVDAPYQCIVCESRFDAAVEARNHEDAVHRATMQASPGFEARAALALCQQQLASESTSNVVPVSIEALQRHKRLTSVTSVQNMLASADGRASGVQSSTPVVGARTTSVSGGLVRTNSVGNVNNAMHLSPPTSPLASPRPASTAASTQRNSTHDRATSPLASPRDPQQQTLQQQQQHRLASSPPRSGSPALPHAPPHARALSPSLQQQQQRSLSPGPGMLPVQQRAASPALAPRAQQTARPAIAALPLSDVQRSRAEAMDRDGIYGNFNQVMQKRGDSSSTSSAMYSTMDLSPRSEDGSQFNSFSKEQGARNTSSSSSSSSSRPPPGVNARARGGSVQPVRTGPAAPPSHALTTDSDDDDDSSLPPPAVASPYGFIPLLENEPLF